MRSLLNTLRRLPEFEDLLLRIDAGRCPVAASGLSPVHRAFVAAGIALRAERPVVLLCADEVDAARLSKDVSALLEQPVMRRRRPGGGRHGGGLPPAHAAPRRAGTGQL